MKSLVEIPINHTHRPLTVLSHWRNEGMLLLNPPYQRGDVWGNFRRANLIKSIMMGVPVPSIVVNDRMGARWPSNDWQYAMIDGKQRCTTLLMFIDDELTVPGSWFGIDKPIISYSDLNDVQKRGFRQRSIGVSEATLGSVEHEKLVFDLINFGGVQQGHSDAEVGQIAKQFVLSEMYAGSSGMACELCGKSTFNVWLTQRDLANLEALGAAEGSLASLSICRMKMGFILCDGCIDIVR